MPLWVAFFWVIVSFFFDIFIGTSKWGASHKYLVWNVYSIVEFLILMTFFSLVFRSKRSTILFSITTILYMGVVIFFSKKDDIQFNSLATAVSTSIFLVFCIVFFIRTLGRIESEGSVPVPIFLIVAGIMLYVASTFFLFLIASKLSEEQINKYWILNAFSNILTNVIFAIAFILNKFQNKVPNPESHTPDYNGFPNDR